MSSQYSEENSDASKDIVDIENINIWNDDDLYDEGVDIDFTCTCGQECTIEGLWEHSTCICNKCGKVWRVAIISEEEIT